MFIITLTRGNGDIESIIDRNEKDGVDVYLPECKICGFYVRTSNACWYFKSFSLWLILWRVFRRCFGLAKSKIVVTSGAVNTFLLFSTGLQLKIGSAVLQCRYMKSVKRRMWSMISLSKKMVSTCSMYFTFGK